MNKSIIYLVAFVLIFSVGAIALVLVSQNNQNSSQIDSDSNNSSVTQAPLNNTNRNTNSTQTVSLGETVFSMAEVEDADNIDRKCLVVYRNNVYEIPSSWKTQHPGGSSDIIRSCGRDITTDFENSHSGSTATRQLESFKVGVLE